MTGQNKRLAQAAGKGWAIRLFDGTGGVVTYLGRCVLAADKPHYETDRETDDGGSRTVIMFRLRPIDFAAGEATMEAETVVSGPVVKAVPIERHEAQTVAVSGQDAYEAERREQRAVHLLQAHLEKLGRTVHRWEITPSGEAKPIYCDLFDATTNLLVEAKGTTSRQAIRMAIGQLRDYGRFIPGAMLAVLTPTRPRPDLLELLGSEGVRAIWQDGSAFRSDHDGLVS